MIYNQKKCRLQNSRIFCERERRSQFERKVWSECRNGEGEWGETCEARALHTRGSRLRRFAPNREEKTTVLQSKRNGTHLLTGDTVVLFRFPVFWVVSVSRITSTGCGVVTAFHGLVVLVIVTQVTVARSPLAAALGNATAHVGPLNLGAIGRPYAAPSMACCTARASLFS